MTKGRMNNEDPNPKTYYKKVYPKGGYVIAEICYEVTDPAVLGSIISEEIIAFSKKFGMSYYTAPYADDYQKAKIWADHQLAMIDQYTTEKTSPDPTRDNKNVQGQGNTSKLDDVIK